MNLESIDKVSTAIQKVTQDVLKDTIRETDTKINKIIDEANTKITGLYNFVPTLEVRVNDCEPKKLSTRAVPYLKQMIVNSKLSINTLLVGPAGCGKTTAGKQLAEALGLQFGSVCLTAGASETWLFGRQTPNGFVEGNFSKIYKEGGVFLADEMDAADANLLLSINTALANDIMFNPMSGETIHKHKDFVFVGAANTFGKGADHVYTGRSRLDGATLDRFLVIEVDYDSDYEKLLCEDKHLFRFLTDVRIRLKSKGYSEFVSTRWFDYAQKLYNSGIGIKAIRNYMSANWCGEAKRECRDAYKSTYDYKDIPDVKTSKKKPTIVKKAKDAASNYIPF